MQKMVVKEKILSVNISCLVDCPFDSYECDCPFKKIRESKNLFEAIESYLEEEELHEIHFLHHLNCSQKRINLRNEGR